MTGDGNSAQIIPMLTYISSFYWKVGGGMTTEVAGDSTSHGQFILTTLHIHNSDKP